MIALLCIAFISEIRPTRSLASPLPLPPIAHTLAGRVTAKSRRLVFARPDKAQSSPCLFYFRIADSSRPSGLKVSVWGSLCLKLWTSVQVGQPVALRGWKLSNSHGELEAKLNHHKTKPQLCGSVQAHPTCAASSCPPHSHCHCLRPPVPLALLPPAVPLAMLSRHPTDAPHCHTRPRSSSYHCVEWRCMVLHGVALRCRSCHRGRSGGCQRGCRRRGTTRSAWTAWSFRPWRPTARSPSSASWPAACSPELALAQACLRSPSARTLPKRTAQIAHRPR